MLNRWEISAPVAHLSPGQVPQPNRLPFERTHSVHAVRILAGRHHGPSALTEAHLKPLSSLWDFGRRIPGGSLGSSPLGRNTPIPSFWLFRSRNGPRPAPATGGVSPNFMERRVTGVICSRLARASSLPYSAHEGQFPQTPSIVRN